MSARRRARRWAQGGRAHAQMAPTPSRSRGAPRPMGQEVTGLGGGLSQLSTLWVPASPAAPLLEILHLAPTRLGGHSPSSRLGRSVSKWTWGCLSEATPYCPGRKAVTSLTLMPSNRDRARRGRRARNVRSDLMGPISAKPRVLATRLIRETCGR